MKRENSFQSLDQLISIPMSCPLPDQLSNQWLCQLSCFSKALASQQKNLCGVQLDLWTAQGHRGGHLTGLHSGTGFTTADGSLLRQWIVAFQRCQGAAGAQRPGAQAQLALDLTDADRDHACVIQHCNLREAKRQICRTGLCYGWMGR